MIDHVARQGKPSVATDDRSVFARMIRKLTRLTGAVILASIMSLAQSPQELASQAGRAMQSKDYPAAERLYRQLIPYAPEMAELHSNLGLACHLQNKGDCAEQALLKALELKKDLFLPNFVMGEKRFKQNRYQEALPLLESALQSQPRQPEVRQFYLATLIGLQRYQAAVKEYRDLIQENPSDVEARYGLGTVYMEMSQLAIDGLNGQEDNGYPFLLTARHYAPEPRWLTFALSAYEDAFEKGIDLPGARVEYAKLQLSQKAWQAARSALETELEVDPYSYEGRFYLAQLALREGDGEESARLLNEAVEIRPEFFLGTQPWLFVPEGESRRQLADALKDTEIGFGSAFLLALLGNAANSQVDAKMWLDRAEKERARYLQAVRDSEPLPTRGEKTGLDLLRRKRYEEGLEMLRPLAASNELQPNTLREMARGLTRVGKYEELAALVGLEKSDDPETIYLTALSYREAALSHLKKMVEMDPGSVRAHQVLGESYMVQERFGDALQEFEKAVDLEAGNAELQYLLGTAFYKQMEFPRAAEVFGQATVLDPLHAEAHLMRGDALVQMGRVEEAISSLQESLKLNSKLTDAHVLLGKAYRTVGQDKQALRHLEKGALVDTDGSVHYQLFILYRKTKQLEKAREALKVSQKLRAKDRKPTI